ncbi:MAG TPA: PilZ domain-containing protein [Magnetospirillaceae bacterium]|jgi:hypothetical protein
MRSMDEKTTTEIIDRLEGAEYRLLKVVASVTEEAAARDVALVLRDLADIRFQLERPLPSDKRAHGRIREPAVAVIKRSQGPNDSAALHDISAGGALIECDNPPAPGTQIVIELPGLGRDVTAAVRGVNGTRAHLSFVELPPEQLVELLKYIERRFQRY